MRSAPLSTGSCAPREQERYHKHVHFWLMRPLGGSLGQHDEEHVAIRWFALPAALQRVTHANTVEVLQKAATLLEGREATGAGRLSARRGR